MTKEFTPPNIQRYAGTVNALTQILKIVNAVTSGQGTGIENPERIVLNSPRFRSNTVLGSNSYLG